MKIHEIKELLSAKAPLRRRAPFNRCLFGVRHSDMMSDVLAFVKDQGVLLTGLVNPQVIGLPTLMDYALCCSCAR